MSDLVDRLSRVVASRMRDLGLSMLNRQLIGTLLEVAYLGTLRAEEGKFVRGSLTFANPDAPDVRPPMLRRADYPAFTKFASPQSLSVQTLVKLSRAIDQWSGSIAVFSTSPNRLFAWGVVDQMVQHNVWWHRESDSGFSNPGLLTVRMDGIGDISVYHGSIFLGGIKAQILINRENDALYSVMVRRFAGEPLMPFARAINSVVGSGEREANIHANLVHLWASSIARLCIGLRQRGTGGAFLLSPMPIKEALNIGLYFEYSQLKEASIMRVLDQEYYLEVSREQHELTSRSEAVPASSVSESMLAETDMNDRERQLTGAVKLVSSLGAVDGLVLMTPTLSVVGFGVKIVSTASSSVIYDGAGFAARGTRARRVDPSNFGTRHGSMLSYCQQDPKALGIVVSQDGYVRLIMTTKNELVLWDNIKLMNHRGFSKSAALNEKRWRSSGERKGSIQLGYTDAPKTIDELIRRACTDIQ